MVNQVARFSKEVNEARGPIRDLGSKRTLFEWSSKHDQAFEKVKACISRLPVLAIFDPSLPTRLYADAAKTKGLGYSLQQQHGNGCKCKCSFTDGESSTAWKNVQCGLQFLQDCETRYAPIEFEALGVAWAVKQCRYFLAGMPTFLILCNHKTLIPILNDYPIDGQPESHSRSGFLSGFRVGFLVLLY